MARTRPISDNHLIPADLKKSMRPRKTLQLSGPVQEIVTSDDLDAADVMTEGRVRPKRVLPEKTRQSVVPGKFPGTFREHDYNERRPPFRPSLFVRLWKVIPVLVVLFLVVFVLAGIMQRTGGPQLMSSNGGKVYDVQVGGDLAGTWQHDEPLQPKTPIPQPVQSGPYSVLGQPTITVDVINQVLAAYQSPAAGKGQALYDMGVQYGIDPVFALAFFMHESTFGTRGIATKSLSLGNLRCIPDHRCEENFAFFDSWEDGFKAWYELIRNLYIAQWGRVTVEQIIPKYAPSADNNNEAAYIQAVEHAVDTWRNGQIIVTG